MLEQLFWKGLIPGPNEGEEAFWRRISQVEHHETLAIGEIDLSRHSKSSLFEYRGRFMSPDWVSLIYSDRGLRLWEGGCSWIDAQGVSIQLRRAFATHTHLYGLYSKQELLAHEGVHAVRLQFSEPLFEEIIAYRTAPSTWRRLLGPLFRSPKESLLFVAICVIVPFLPSIALPFLVAIILFFGLRLWRLQRAYQRTLDRLATLTTCSPFHWSIALTDQEIWRFSHLSPQNILSYIHSQHSLRWKQLQAVFLTPSTTLAKEPVQNLVDKV